MVYSKVRVFFSNFLFFLAGVIASFGIEEWMISIKALSPLIKFGIALATVVAAIVIRPKPNVRTKYIVADGTRARKKKALIGLVSTFKGYGDAQHSKTKTLLDYERMIDQDSSGTNPPDFTKTNLGPLIAVIEEYENLEKIWLITTDESRASANLLKKYFVKYKNFRDDNIVYGKDWSIKNAFTTNTPNDIKGLVLEAQNQAKRDYTPKQIVTDITGGVKGMQVGAILACVNPNMDVQYSVIDKTTNSLSSAIYTFEIEVIS